MSQEQQPDTNPSDKTTVTDAEPASEATDLQAGTDAEERPKRAGMAVAAFVVTVAAWVLLPLYYPGALGGGILALILSILALRQPRGAWRNLALVTTVASSVLLLILAIFWTALLLALKYL